MRTTLLTIIFLMGVTAQAQKITITPFAGYMFKERVSFYSGQYADVSYGFHYGGSLEYFARKNTSIELMYQRQDATMKVYKMVAAESSDITVQYATLGVLRYHSFNEILKGYAGMNAGIAFGKNKETNIDYTRLGVGFRGGVLVVRPQKLA